MENSDERLHILDMIESGRISAEDGLMLLRALVGRGEADDLDANLADDATAYAAPASSADGGEAVHLDASSGGERAWQGAPVPLNDGAPSPAEDFHAGYPPPLPDPRPPLEPHAPFEGGAKAPGGGDEAGRAAFTSAARANGAPGETHTAPVGAASYATPAASANAAPGGIYAAPASAAPGEPHGPPPGGLPPEALKWKRWWMLPLWVGVFITIWGGLFMYWSATAANGLSLWFVCASVPFVIGVALTALAFRSRTAPWLHLRVRQKPGEKPQTIAFSFPLPLGPTAWFFRTFGGRIQGLRGVQVDQILTAMGGSVSPENPIYIQADEGEDGDKVEIYIG